MGYGGLSEYEGQGVKLIRLQVICEVLWKEQKVGSFLLFSFSKGLFFIGGEGKRGVTLFHSKGIFFPAPLERKWRGVSFQVRGPFQWGVVSWLTWERGEVWLFLNVRVEFSLFFLLLPRSCSWKGWGGVFIYLRGFLNPKP